MVLGRDFKEHMSPEAMAGWTKIMPFIKRIATTMYDSDFPAYLASKETRTSAKTSAAPAH